MTNVFFFDKALVDLTEIRGADYGHPNDDFALAMQISHAVEDCPNPQIRQALRMIGVKMARLCHSPTHLDSIIDIAGYARTMAMCLDKQKEEQADADK
jgi:hypothetical protein